MVAEVEAVVDGSRVLQEDVDVIEDGVRLSHLLQIDETSNSDSSCEPVVTLALGNALNRWKRRSTQHTRCTTIACLKPTSMC